MGKDALKEKGWGTESGLPDNFTHLVKEAWFGPNEESERDPDKIYLNLRGPAFENGEAIGDDDGYVLRFGVGKNWEAIKSGAAVEHANGATKFHRNSGCGNLVTAIGEVMTPELEEVLGKRGAPTQAKTFIDLAFRYERKTVSKFKSEDTGENVEWVLPLPVEFLGVGEEALGGKKKAKVAKVEKAKKKADDDDDDDAEAQAALRKKVVKFAKQYEDDEYDDFKDEVLDKDIFKQAGEIGEELKAEILDEEEGIWAEAHGE